jgi:hypothetical protein
LGEREGLLVVEGLFRGFENCPCRGEMENYEPIGVLGKGSFGKVSKIRRISDGRVRYSGCDFYFLVLALTHWVW